MIAAAAALGSACSAFAGYVPTFDITNNQSGSIYDMILCWKDPQGGGIGTLNAGPEPGFTAAPGFSQIQDAEKPRFPSGVFVLGLYTETPVDPNPGQDHVVLFMNDYAASLANGVAFETLFPNTSESELIADLHSITATGDFDANDNGTYLNFLFNDSQQIPNGGSATGHTSAWAIPGATSGSPATGKIMMFSDGQQIGSFATYAPATTPEPASMAALGFGALALIRRRKKA